MTDDIGKTRAKELGLNLRHSTDLNLKWYHADDVHRLLSSGKQVWGTNGRGSEIDYRANMWAPDPGMFNNCDHHLGLIIGIRPAITE